MKLVLALLLLTINTNLFCYEFNDKINRWKLKNGMTWITLEDNSIPSANMYLFWRTGSRNEYPGTTGLAHFFEHMMFNGSKNFPSGSFDRIMEANGGANNAYTTEDMTVYTNWFPTTATETIFELEADRIKNLRLEPKVVESERGVVLSERSTGLENSNWRLMYEEMKGIAFRAHPYSWPVIGHESDIKNWTIEDLRSFYKAYYAPNNAVVVVAGDIEFSVIKKLSKKHFEAIPKGPPIRKIHTVEPLQKGERRAFVSKPSLTSPNLMLGYKIPSTNHEDIAALDLINSLLTSGKTSHLYQDLVDKNKVASAVESYLPDSFDPNIFYFFAVAMKDVSASKLEKEMTKSIEEFKQKPVAESDLQKVKNQSRMDFYRTMETINGKANLIGTFELKQGDYKKITDYQNAIQAVTRTDILRVARKYLKISGRSVVILDREES